MLKGYIDQKVNRAFASERRVGSFLRCVAPYHHNHRQQGTERQLNPQPNRLLTLLNTTVTEQQKLNS